MDTLKTILTPELDKMLANKEASQAIGEFLNYLQNEKKICLKVYEKEYINYFDEAFEKKVKKLGEESMEGRIERWNNTDKWEYAGGWSNVNKSIEQMLAEYFKIDLNKCEKERRAILDNLRKQK